LSVGMPVCTACGSDTDEGHKFCAICGTKQGQAESRLSKRLSTALTISNVTSSPPAVSKSSSSSSLVCFTCKKPFSGTHIIRAIEKCFHPSCFICTACSCTLSTYYDYEGMPYCENHYDEKAYDKCAVCHNSIVYGEQQILDGKGGVYHAKCFKCQQCSAQLGVTFYWMNDKIVARNVRIRKRKCSIFGCLASVLRALR